MDLDNLRGLFSVSLGIKDFLATTNMKLYSENSLPSGPKCNIRYTANAKRNAVWKSKNLKIETEKLTT